MPQYPVVKIVATRPYERRVEKLLTPGERRTAEDEIADDPLGWPVIRGTGGARKARAAREAPEKAEGYGSSITRGRRRTRLCFS